LKSSKTDCNTVKATEVECEAKNIIRTINQNAVSRKATDVNNETSIKHIVLNSDKTHNDKLILGYLR